MHVYLDTSLLSHVTNLQTTPKDTSLTGRISRSSEKPAQDKTDSPKAGQSSDVVHLTQPDSDLAKLKARDREVRAHESAHAAAAGSVVTGGPQFTYQRGSDGRLYAVGGEVSIDTSSVSGDPQATIQKAQTIRAAALAPANPSAQDRAVATQANRMEAQARQELQQERTAEIQEAANGASSEYHSP
ncbi:MAG: putative metalloprotease CJM1_0395 family protein, partial [Nitrospirota bacterium]|nr:putative metalloprotease CJM1_0395 family protein [Nitrospirota bacterium]